MFRKRSLVHRRILITGASSGIGSALAEQLAGFSSKLLLTARRQDRLEALVERLWAAGAEQVIIAPGDITDPLHRKALRDRCEREWGGLDILVNNAGVGGIGTFISAPEPRLRQIMEVNFFAPVELIRVQLPLLRQSDDPVIVNVGSVLGHCAVPKKSEYCASKFALHGFTDSLRIELASEGIDVLMVSPSTTQSEFFDSAMRSEGDAATSRRAMTPGQVARGTIHALRHRRREVILSMGGKLLVAANRIVPGILSRLLGKFG